MNRLSSPLIRACVFFLNTKDSIQCFQVCKSWKKILSEESHFWKNLYTMRWSLEDALPLYDWKHNCQVQVDIDKGWYCRESKLKHQLIQLPIGSKTIARCIIGLCAWKEQITCLIANEERDEKERGRYRTYSIMKFPEASTIDIEMIETRKKWHSLLCIEPAIPQFLAKPLLSNSIQINYHLERIQRNHSLTEIKFNILDVDGFQDVSRRKPTIYDPNTRTLVMSNENKTFLSSGFYLEFNKEKSIVTDIRIDSRWLVIGVHRQEQFEEYTDKHYWRFYVLVYSIKNVFKSIHCLQSLYTNSTKGNGCVALYHPRVACSSDRKHVEIFDLVHGIRLQTITLELVTQQPTFPILFMTKSRLIVSFGNELHIYYEGTCGPSYTPCQ